MDLKEFEEYKDLIKYRDVVNILDFSRGKFNKSFSLTPKKEIKTKWKLVKLGNYVETLNGLWKGKKEPFVRVNVIRNTNFEKNGKLDLNDVAVLEVEKKQYEKRKLEYGDIIVEKSGGSNTQAVGRVVFFDQKNGEYSYSNFTSRLRLISKDFYSKYLFLFLDYFYQLGYTFNFQNGMSGIKNLDFKKYLDMKIPLPPKNIQQKIVDECEQIDNEVQKAEESIKRAREEIEKIVTEEQSAYKKLNEVVIKVSETINPKMETGIVNYIGLENIESNTSQLVGDIKVNFSEIKSNKIVFGKDDIL